jgi:N-acetylglutamate synthase-like GNAT family acetyltransferase
MLFSIRAIVCGINLVVSDSQKHRTHFDIASESSSIMDTASTGTCVCSQIEFGTVSYAESLNLRDEVLRKPLGLQFSDEELQQERNHFHLVCYEGNKLAGCLVLVPLGDALVKMRQVAVAPWAQRRGVGRELTKFAEGLARQQGFKKISLHARDTAIPFYERLSYQRVGNLFEEVTISHCEMQKEL